MNQVTNLSKSKLKNYTYLDLMQTIAARLQASSAVSNQKALAAITDFRQKVAAYKALEI